MINDFSFSFSFPLLYSTLIYFSFLYFLVRAWAMVVLYTKVIAYPLSYHLSLFVDHKGEIHQQHTSKIDSTFSTSTNLRYVQAGETSR